MTDIDLTAAVDAAARRYYELHIKTLGPGARRGNPPVDWEYLSQGSKFAFREIVLPLVHAAHRHIAAQAWETGYVDGKTDCCAGTETPNPYEETR